MIQAQDFSTLIAKLTRARIAVRAIGPTRLPDQNQHLANVANAAIGDVIAMLKNAREAKLAHVVELRFRADEPTRCH